MTISDRPNADESDIMDQEWITELGKANQELSRRNLVLEGINRIFSIVVKDKTEEELENECLSVALRITGSQLGFVNLVGDDGLLHDIAISDMGWKQCLMYDKTGHRRPKEILSFMDCTEMSLTARKVSLLTIRCRIRTVLAFHLAIPSSLLFLACPLC